MYRLIALIRILCALSVAVSFHVTYTPPYKPAAHERAPTTSAGERVLKFTQAMLKVIKGVFWSVGTTETLAIIVSQLPPTDFKRRLLYTLLHRGNIDDLILTPVALVGLFLIVFGSWVRWKCYQELKSLFTFQLSIRKDHRLVTTGPYSVVRHPSYTGLLATHIGMYCWYGSRGSWLVESGLLQTQGGILAAVVFTVIMTAGLIGTLSRVAVEDRDLRKVFGSEWDQFASRVRYSLIPGIY